MTQPQIVLFNSGKNPLAGEYELDGKKHAYKLMPNKAGCFPKHEAEKLKRLYSDVVIDEADARAKFSPAAVMAEQREAEFAAAASKPRDEASTSQSAGPVTEEDKDRIRSELTAVLVRMQDRGMSVEEVNAIASQAQIAATLKKQVENETAAASKKEAEAPAAPAELAQDPAITEEESEAAIAAIQAVRAKKAAANPDAPENQPASIMQRVRDVLAGKESA